MTTVAVIGADGQLGTDMLPALESNPDYSIVPLTLDDMDVRDAGATRSTLLMNSPDIVINTAAYHAVDACEEHAEEAFLINAAAVHNLARICREMDAVLVHFSTDFVFDGAATRRVPFTESDTPNPRSVYAASKLAGEWAVRNVWHKHFTVRTCGLYGLASIAGRNASRSFVELMLRLAGAGDPIRVVNDQRLAPTTTRDLAAKLVELMATECYGLYHITNTGSCTWFEFAQELFQLSGLAPNLTPITTQEWSAPAARPAYSVLDCQALRQAGLKPLRSWQKALAAYLETRAASMGSM
ncbi:dTDP-4-dehydrorhamnose reductase [Myxococcota bacterium]